MICAYKRMSGPVKVKDLSLYVDEAFFGSIITTIYHLVIL